MSYKIKVMTIIGTRPEIIRLSRVIDKLDAFCDHTLVHTGQNYDYELNKIFFEDMNIRMPDKFLNLAGANAAETIGKIIISVDKVLEEYKPDALLILGDTNSCLSAIAAKRKKVPIFHMEAGNRCFDFRVPEEINRRIADHISDINLPYSKIAREYLLKEGLPPDQIIVTGSPMKEVLEYSNNKIKNSKILQKLSLKKGNYFVVSVHREENVDNENNFRKILNSLEQICIIYQQPIIFSTHPRTRNRIKSIGWELHPMIKLCKPFGFSDFVKLQLDAHATLSDSGTITEESSILNFPAINIREAHERPEGMEEGAVMMVGVNSNRILNAIEILDNTKARGVLPQKLVEDYNTDNVSDKIVKIIISYTNYVNQKVWKKGQNLHE